MPLSIVKTISRTGSNAVRVDGVFLIMIKIVLHHLTPIEHLFNFSFMSGIFSSQWKVTMISPIPKTRSPATV